MNVETANRQVDNQFLTSFLVRKRFSLIPEEQGENRNEKIVKEEFRAFFDVDKHSDEVIARVFQEERSGVSFEERITHAENYFEGRIKTDNWTYNKHSESEKKATIEVFNLIEKGFDLIVWISPKSDIYEEGRLNIMLPGIKDGEKFFDPWGIPISFNWKESVELGNKLLDNGGTLTEEASKLRERPIGFKLKTNENWIKKCEELMPEMKWAWETIESGRVDKNMKKLALKIKEAKEIAKGNNVLFERTMLNMGYKLNVSGNHGGSRLGSELGNGIGVIVIRDIGGGVSYRIGRTEGLTQCSKCGCWYSGEKCPICS